MSFTTMANREKKPVEYYFIDMNDPGRYKKLKVSHACDFCRQRKSKCDVGVPGSGVCSNCRKANVVCVFSGKDSSDENRDYSLDLSVEPSSAHPPSLHSSHPVPPAVCLEPQQQQQQQQHDRIPRMSKSTALLYSIYDQFPAFQLACPDRADQLCAAPAVGGSEYRASIPIISNTGSSMPLLRLSQKAEHALYQAYSRYIHPYFPVLHQTPSSLSVYSALLVLMCYIRPPELCNSLPLSAEAYLHQAQVLCLDECSLSAVQTLLLLHKHQEMTTTLPCMAYLERASTIFDKLVLPGPQYHDQNLHHRQQQQQLYTNEATAICKIRWLLYVSMALTGHLAHQNATYKRWFAVHDERQLVHDLPYFASSATDGNDHSTENFVELIKLAKLYTQVTQQPSRTPFTFYTDSLAVDDKFQQELVKWKLSLPRHLYTGTATMKTIATAAVGAESSSMDYNAFYSTCLLFLSDTLSLSLSANESSPAEERSSSLSESLATAARIQQCAHTLATTGSFMVVSQPIMLLALKLALNELMCAYTTWIAFEQHQNSIVHWVCDWFAQTIYLCNKLKMDTAFPASLQKLHDSMLSGTPMYHIYHEDGDDEEDQDEEQLLS
ncbi:hypothetical protein BDB00DRAFT_582628 [Zychaea mexicana]|uniref:uncharacterized protein n=1 Tax=Zychaea mexicana TaxID=64656 RepID=UPI0022FE889C|nr:uncharacterized protein BDB00DRAFT_582628 [Zychaea mexicana]KAI9497593.1 hypothetical protein BDB00DRAFT_582628 [Zychaea mexicana]